MRYRVHRAEAAILVGMALSPTSMCLSTNYAVVVDEGGGFGQGGERGPASGDAIKYRRDHQRR